MFPVQKVNCAMFCNKIAFKESLLHFRGMAYHIKLDKLAKRGLILDNMVADKDKRKNWHFNIMANKSLKSRNVFEKVHKPRRRESMLNSLFIKNITDVVSTGDVAPELLGYGIEITGVKIDPCCRTLNVFWQVPVKHDGTAEEIAEKLSKVAPQIRAELISRNVMGRVPQMFFLRDGTNAKIAAFEEAMMKLDLPKDSESSIVPDDSFVTDMYNFKDKRVTTEKDKAPKVEREEKVCQGIPQNPPDMKSDIFGINHDIMMEKIIALKKKSKDPQKSALITTQMLKEGDIFSKIPGMCFQPDTTRETIMKNFQIDRRKRMQKKTNKIQDDDFQDYEEDTADDYDLQPNMIRDDFVEDITDNFKHGNY